MSIGEKDNLSVQSDWRDFASGLAATGTEVRGAFEAGLPRGPQLSPRQPCKVCPIPVPPVSPRAFTVGSTAGCADSQS